MCKGRSPSRKEARPLLQVTGIGRLDLRNVLRLHALLATGRLVGNLGALFEGPESVALYRAVVHEEVIASIVLGDEAVALLVVEPLDRSLGHLPSPPFFPRAPSQ